MPIQINNVTRRVVYAASGTGPYNFTFEILAAADIAVYRDNTLLTITSDYTVTINANGTGYVTLTATPTGATQIAIVGNRTIQRLTDFVTGGDFFANTLNDELDQQTIFAQQNAEGLGRALQAPQTDPTTINMVLPKASDRANKTLNFDVNGNPVAGLAVVATATAAVATWMETPSSANLRAAVTDETGTGALVFATSPALTTPTLGAASATSVALDAGAVGTPSLTATGDLNTGMWFPAADTLAWSTGGSERMRVDSSGNVGIGTSSPTARLHVGASGGTIQLRLGNNTGSDYWGIGRDNVTTGDLVFQGQTTEYMRLTASGNLGLGTSSPGAKLDVYDTGNTTLRLSGSSGGGGDVSQIDFFRIGSNVTSSIKAIRDTSNTSGALTFFTALSGVNTERMRLDSSGNLGIGTSSPSAVLHVKSSNGTIISETTAARNSNNNFLSFRDATGEAGYVGYGAGGANFYTWNNLNAALLFGTNNFERMRITSGGVLCVGDSATGDATGAHIKATTITNSNVGVVRIQSAKTSDSADTALSVIKQANDSTTAQVFVRFVINAAANGCGQINANGANTAAFGTYSDARLKENIVDLPPQLASICALRPVEFDYIQSEGGGHQIGFIAQEMEQVYPDVVGERSDGMKTITAWSKTEARLVKAIQEQQIIIESLIARIAALEAKGA